MRAIRSCEQCDPTQRGRRDHPARHVVCGDQEACIDMEIADLILACWEHGIRTTESCQDWEYDTDAAIWFRTISDYMTFGRLVLDGAKRERHIDAVCQWQWNVEPFDMDAQYDGWMAWVALPRTDIAFGRRTAPTPCARGSFPRPPPVIPQSVVSCTKEPGPRGPALACPPARSNNERYRSTMAVSSGSIGPNPGDNVGKGGTVKPPSVEVPVVDHPDKGDDGPTSVHPDPDLNPGNSQPLSAADPRPNLPHYTYSDWDKGPDGTGLDPGPDRAMWKDSRLQTESGERLLTFINDQPGGEPTVDDPRFKPYTGKTKPAEGISTP